MIDNNRFFVTILRKEKKKDFEIFLISAFQKYIFYMCAFVSTLEKLRKHYVFFVRCIWLQKIERNMDF